MIVQLSMKRRGTNEEEKAVHACAVVWTTEQNKRPREIKRDE